MFAIAIVGQKASGKGAVAHILGECAKAFVMRFSDPIRVADILERTGLPVSSAHELAERTAKTFQERGRASTDAGDFFNAAYYQRFPIEPPATFQMQEMGNALRQQHGVGVLTEVLLEAAQLLGQETVVIDGVRNPGEVASLEKRLTGRFVLVGVTADTAIRKHRFLEKRKRIGDPETEAEFERLERKDMGEDQPPDGQQVAKCLALVSPGNMLTNNTTLDALTVQVMAWYDTFSLFEK